MDDSVSVEVDCRTDNAPYSTTPSAVILTLRFEYVRDVIYIFLKFHRQTPSLGTQGQLAGVNVRADFAAVLCLLFVTPAGVFKY